MKGAKTTATKPKTTGVKTGGKKMAATAGKTAAKKTTKPAAKTTAAKKAKAAPKAAGKKTAAPKKNHAPAPATGSNVFWKFLEMKEARRKEHAGEKPAAAGGPAKEGRVDPIHEKFSRFAGPRRRSV